MTKLLTPKPEISYMTAQEAGLFKHQREVGVLSFFRTALCENCGEETLKHKKYCSRKCFLSKEPEQDVTADVIDDRQDRSLPLPLFDQSLFDIPDDDIPI